VKQFIRKVNQAKLRYFSTAARYKYGFEVPRTYEHDMRLYKRNVNTLWGDAITLELTKIGDYNTFSDKGHHTKANEPSGYKKIRVNFVIDVKHDVRHKDMPLADSHLTQINVNLIYSSIVSLQGFQPVLFLVK
jgi:hypothetical protein